jgi:eukaryotic-like serine/threonine-protein kinase
VTGQTLADAETTLAELSLTPLPATQANHETVPVGSVISWSVPAEPTLAAGDEVLPETEVALVVSSGPAPRTVPNLVNTPFPDAKAALDELRLKVQRGEPRFHPEIPRGSIVAQRPAPQTEVARDSTVTVRVSKGPDLRRVPRLEGFTLFKARQRLRDAGLRVGRLLGSTRGIVVDATANGQPVVPGDRLRRGTPVNLVLF